jgi:hypothetical protein
MRNWEVILVLDFYLNTNHLNSIKYGIAIYNKPCGTGPTFVSSFNYPL